MITQIERAVMIGFYVAVTMGGGACLSQPGVACGDKWCPERTLCAPLGSDVDHQQLMCVETCMADTDCAAAGICDTGRCRVARSCAEILQHFPGSKDDKYRIAPGTAAPFDAVCNMTPDGNGWTLLLKATGEATLGYDAPFWTDTILLNETDLTTQPGNAKYQSFLSLPVTTLRGELDGFVYQCQKQEFAGMTAQQIFAGSPVVLDGFPVTDSGAPYWSTQPSCQAFGINASVPYAKTRFGWSANDQITCDSNDTAIGLGLTNNEVAPRGAGYECLGSLCDHGMVNASGNGLLWAK